MTETGILLTEDMAAVVVHGASVCFSEGLGSDDYKSEARLMTDIASAFPFLKEGCSWLPWESWEEGE